MVGNNFVFFELGVQSVLLIIRLFCNRIVNLSVTFTAYLNEMSVNKFFSYHEKLKFDLLLLYIKVVYFDLPIKVNK